MTNEEILKKLPTIPDYFKAFVDKDVDLNVTRNIPCPFHQEKAGKSFTYSPDKNVWRCWGACKCGGDVIALHKLNYRLKTKEDAIKSLCNILGISAEIEPTFEPIEYKADEVLVERNTLYNQACKRANNTKRYLELDYILGKYPFDVEELKDFIHMCDEGVI